MRTYKQNKHRPRTKHTPVKPFTLRVDNNNITQEVSINLIPLIDVVFCILTVFILASVAFSRQQAINLNLPKASTATPQMRQMLVVSLDEFGEVYVEKERIVTRDDLNKELKRYLLLNPNGVIALNAARNVSYNKVVDLLDSLREVGGDRVALATLPGESNKPMVLNEDLTSPNNLQLPDTNSLPNNPTQLPNTMPNNTQLPTESTPNIVPLPPTNSVPQTNINSPN
jgi:biopolymer transport protein ExbD